MSEENKLTTEIEILAETIEARTGEFNSAFEKIKKDWAHLFDFKGAIDGGYTKKEIVEELSKKTIEFLTIRSVNSGIRKLKSNDEDRMIGVLKGGVIGSIIGYLIGLIIEISMFLIKRFKNEKYRSSFVEQSKIWNNLW